MPAVTENTMVDSKGEVVTDFIDSVGTSSVSYTYTNTQTSLYIRNDSDVSITVTVNGSPTTVTRLSDTTITAEFTSFSIVSASGIASFYARSLRGVPTNTTSTSQLNVISGTAASPSITAIADANTGIFFPASETIAFSTNGSERARITSTGNVGIGTTSPSSILHISSATASFSPSFRIINTGTANDQQSTMALSTDNSTSNPFLIGKNSVANGADAFLSNQANSAMIFETNGTARMRITSTGNVGIGTTSPAYTLDTNGIVRAKNAFYIGRSTDSAVIGSVKEGTSNGLKIQAESGGADSTITFATNGGDRAIITSAGNVGIGTTSPNTTFSWDRAIGISGTNSSAVELMTGATLNSVFATSATQTNLGTISNIPLVVLTNNSEKMRITSAGNVGIGTTSPAAKLHVSDASASNSNVTIQLTNTQSSKNLILGSSATAFAYQGIGNNDSFVLSDLSNLTLAAWNSSAIKFVTGTTEKARFDSNGYLLIGYTTSNGAYPLQVNGQIFATSSTIATSDGRYKKDVVSLDGALDIVKALNPVQFSWKDHPVHKFNTDVPTVGFIAQEVEQALADKSYLTSIIKKSECSWETETGEFVQREVTRDVEKQVTREVEREITETIDGEEVTRTITEEVTETVIEQVTEIVTEPVKETHTEEFLGIAESNLIAILTKAVKELTAKVEALEAQLNGN